MSQFHHRRLEKGRKKLARTQKKKKAKKRSQLSKYLKNFLFIFFSIVYLPILVFNLYIFHMRIVFNSHFQTSISLFYVYYKSSIFFSGVV